MTSPMTKKSHSRWHRARRRHVGLVGAVCLVMVAGGGIACREQTGEGGATAGRLSDLAVVSSLSPNAVGVVGAGQSDAVLAVRHSSVVPLHRGGGRLVVLASDDEGRWLRALRLRLDMAGLAQQRPAPLLQSASCRVRFIQQGRLSEAEMGVSWAKLVRKSGPGSQDLLSMEVGCRKRLQFNLANLPYASAIPDSIEITGQVPVRLHGG